MRWVVDHLSIKSARRRYGDLLWHRRLGTVRVRTLVGRLEAALLDELVGRAFGQCMAFLGGGWRAHHQLVLAEHGAGASERSVEYRHLES